MRVAEHQKNTPQSCKILQRKTAMSLSISDPVKILTNEIVKIEVSFEIEDDFSKEDAKLTLQCNKESSIGLSKGDLLVKDPNQHLVFNLKSTSEKFTIWMKNETATFAEPSLLVASVSLSVDDYVCALRAERRIPPAIPFKVATKCLTNSFMPLSALSTASESFLLVVSAELLEKDESLNIPLRINRIEYEESASICKFKKDSFAQEPVSLNLGDCAQFVIPLSKKSGASLSNLLSVELGRLKLFWSREENAADEFCFSASLGTLQLKNDKEEQVAVTAKLPEVCQRWEPFDLEIQVSNVTSELKRCSLEVETSSDFQILSLPASFSLLPSERSHVATVSYFPVNCGELLLPKLTLKHSGDETIAIHSVVSRSLLVRPSPRATQLARLKAYPVNCDT